MISAGQANSVRFPFAALAVVALGVLIALGINLALAGLTLAKCAFILGGFALLIPTLALKDPKTFWLFLLVLSMPFDISKWLTSGIVDPQSLVDKYGEPASGTVAIELYLTDVVLLMMLLPWLARVSLRREKLYFPKLGYLFVIYLGWALLVSLINAESLYLAFFEFCREVLYFLSFVYLINNVTTREQLRTVVLAVFFGLIIGAGSIITFFEMGIGTDTIAFAGLRDQPGKSDLGKALEPGKTHVTQNLTVNITEPGLGSQFHEHGSAIKRSQGIFRHPGIAASLCGLTLPLALAYLIAARANRERILYLTVYLWGVGGLVLTFSRAGLLGFLVGTLVCFALGGWAGLISRRILKLGAVILALLVALGIPLLLAYFETRPESYDMRFNLFWTALHGYWQHPILGVGLNNSTAAMKEGKQILRDLGIKIPAWESVDNQYLAVLTEIGPVGFVLFFGFIGWIVTVAVRAIREVPIELKPPLIGIVAGLMSLATQDLADDPLTGHVISAMVWLFAALIVVICRKAATLPAGDHAGLINARS
jgi:hypothetical protein